MKRKLFTALAILALFTFTACQEDAAMEELLQDTTLNSYEEGTGTGNGSGGSGAGGNGDDPPGGN